MGHGVEAERLLEGRGMPLLFRGAARPILRWLASLPAAELDARPSLWVTYASALLFISQVAGVEEKLQAAEAALRNVEPDDKIRDLIGHIASIRATVAVTQHDAEAIIAQSQRALAYLHPDNLPVRTAATWALAYAHQLQGDRAAAGLAYAEALAASEPMGLRDTGLTRAGHGGVACHLRRLGRHSRAKRCTGKAAGLRGCAGLAPGCDRR